MIRRLIDWCGRNRFLVSLAVAAIAAWGIWSVKNIPLDAIPDISDTQVVVYAQWMKSPDILEDQVAYPIVRALLGAPRVKSIRASSDFGYSYIYVLFEDGTDVYWARSRVLEYLSKIQGTLPPGVKVEMGPDASGVGWVYQYALVDRSGRHTLSELKSYQDWNLRYQLQSLPGVAEVSTVGGETKQYQVEVNPNALAAYDLAFSQVLSAVRDSNRDVGGRLLELNGAEYMIRGLGYLKSVKDLENVAVGRDRQGTPILVRDVARVELGPEVRRGVAELDGQGEVVGGIVTARYGENALKVIERVKQRIEELKPSLPPGVELVPVYDRSELIDRSIDTLTHELLKLALAVSLVCLIFLWHFRSALVIILTLPLAILMSFIAMRYMGVSSNIMSLGGIAIAIGAMVDASIIMVENAVKRLEEWEADRGRNPSTRSARSGLSRTEVIIGAAQEVGPALFNTLLVITAGFLPVFALQGQEGKLFSPLAYTKTFSMFFAAFLAVTVTPFLMTLSLKGKILPEKDHPVGRFLERFYRGPAQWALQNGGKVLAGVGIILALTLLPFLRLGSEFMPDLWEGSLLYMPTTLPGISVTEAARILQSQDRVLKSFPEVERVFGKAGRAETPLDPAPLSMVETTVLLKPESQWRKGMTRDQLLSEMNDALQFPGWTNAMTMPIINRINMLTTGVRTPIGIKVLGTSLPDIEKAGLSIEKVLAGLKGTRSVYAERVTGGYYVDIRPKRDQVARYGLKIEDVNELIEMAIGGDRVTTTVEGRERYPVSVRYARDYRDDVGKLRRVLVTTPSGTKVQLGQLADVSLTLGPGMIRDENGLLAGYVYVDTEGVDPGTYVGWAKALIRDQVKLPEGTRLAWSGQYEYKERADKRLLIMVPLALLLVFLLIYFNTGSFTETFLVLMAVPFSLVGAVWLLWALHYNTSVAVWVGMIALAGLDAETGVVMLLYLKMAYEGRRAKGRMRDEKDLREAVMEGAVKRLRPKLMTVCAAWFGLVPILFSTGAGSDVMKRIAAPMVGGVATSFILELLVYPVLFTAWKWNTELSARKGRGLWRWIRNLG
ncbi:MAG TPA: CusA/CzcA family heavy metal efflux RND transporter [bacterium]|nr:CusA/CzcA family heavy metal efflux RND transporter [bacterium]